MPAWRHKCKICTSEWHRLVDMLRLENGYSFSRIIKALQPFDLYLNKANLWRHFKKHVNEVDKLETKIFKKEDELHVLKMRLAEEKGT